MSLADIIRNGVAIAHNITNDGELQETVTLKRWTGQSTSGVYTYATAIQPQALVVRNRFRFQSADGEDIVSTCQVIFLAPLSPLAPAVAGRKGVVDTRDQLVLSTGERLAILGMSEGLADPTTSAGYVLHVFCGFASPRQH